MNLLTAEEAARPLRQYFLNDWVLRGSTDATQFEPEITLCGQRNRKKPLFKFCERLALCQTKHLGLCGLQSRAPNAKPRLGQLERTFTTCLRPANSE